MAENKKSFVLYADLIKSIEHLTNEEKGILFNHLLEYVNDKNPVLEDRLILTAWKPIELQLKRDLLKFEEVKAKRSDAGKRSAELRALSNVKQKTTKSTSVKSVQQTSTNSTDNVNVNDTVNDNVILLEKETKEIDFSPFGDDFKIHWVTWTAYKKSQFGFRYKELKTEQMAFNDLVKKSNSNKLHAISIINNSMVNGWKGLMPLKDVYPTFELHSQTHKRREIGTTKSMFE